MIVGSVNDRLEAIIVLHLRGVLGEEIDVEAVIDTGYSESLTLPQTVIDSLSASRVADGELRLADGVPRRFPIYLVNLLWDGELTEVLASALGDTPLIGMNLLSGYQMHIGVRVGGQVRLIKM